MTDLPEKLSDCILLAVRDLEAVEQNPLYRIDMTTWHEIPHLVSNTGTEYFDYTCSVCFAGAVMAQSLGADRDANLCPHDFSPHNQMRLRALNEVRMGTIRGALRTMNEGEFPDKWRELYEYSVVQYDEDPKAFKKEMKRIAYDLARIGL